MSGALRPAGIRFASWLIGGTPPGFGQARVAGPIYRRWLARGEPVRARARLRGGARAELYLRDRIQGMTFLIRDYDPGLIRFLASRLGAGGVFVDVGAHVGLVSLSVAARCRGAGIRVLSFEPDPLNAEAFRRNLELNPGLDVTLNEAAVGARPGRATLRRVGDRERACARIVDSSDVGRGDEVDVDVVPLAPHLEAQGIEEVGVLKIDVEGHEAEVLDGAEPLLREGRVRWLVLEVNDERLAARGSSREELYGGLERHGYRPASIPQPGLRRIIPRPQVPNEDVAFHLALSR